ncbi:C39 family peptidase [Nocardioides sp. CFH 31398]|uniref:C39 family peptidase n=1 Tax=Nocardioides sp. CFH 31398 TaxID=2919579 RepID=UPI001F05B06D|nr:C39 family peptidase [Nocardioides sp. CFH 31398]MCH1865909.1 C39 family peptidase [Nocardioides sp. CFH 31398]
MPSFPTARGVSALLGPALAATLVLPTATVPPASGAPLGTLDAATPTRAEPAGRLITYKQWASGRQLAQGKRTDTYVSKGAVRLRTQAPVRQVGDRRYQAGTWTSPWTWPGYGLTEMVASWDARTPGDSWIRVEARGRSAGRMSSWDTLGEWTSGEARERTTISGQDDDLARVNVDTLEATTAAGLHSWQLRVTLLKREGARTGVPSLETVGAMVSRLPETSRVPTSRTGPARGKILDVPSYSQMVHRGHSPQWGGGGEAWCSPTSVSMVLGYHQALPRPAAYAWTGSGHTAGFVDHAARMSYDHGYDGAGNWPFSTAYASQHVSDAFVTRLRDLREAERFIAAGIPLVTSIRFSAGQLSGAPISSSNGHLLVVVGFTRSGDVVVNDPAASSAGGVRRVYDRGQFENVWIPTSGGLTYVIRDDQRLPDRVQGSTRNW